MLEESITIALDNFNRFRRPLAEAKLVDLAENTATVRFACKDVGEYAEYLRKELESSAGFAEVESVSGNIAKFIVKDSGGNEAGPLEKALRILDKYNEGTVAHFGFED